jgi:uncharacterized membrane protein
MISSLLLGIWLILVGVSGLGWITIDVKILGLLAFVTGLVILIEGVRPILKR